MAQSLNNKDYRKHTATVVFNAEFGSSVSSGFGRARAYASPEPQLTYRPGVTTLRDDCPQAWSPRLGWRQHRRLAQDRCLDGWFRQRSILEPQRPFGEPLDPLFGCGQGQPLDPVLGVLAGLSTKLLLVLGEGGRPP